MGQESLINYKLIFRIQVFNDVEELLILSLCCIIRYLERVAAEREPSASLLDHEEEEAGPVPAIRCF